MISCSYHPIFNLSNKFIKRKILEINNNQIKVSIFTQDSNRYYYVHLDSLNEVKCINNSCLNCI